jgi:hypothetical protein
MNCFLFTFLTSAAVLTFAKDLCFFHDDLDRARFIHRKRPPPTEIPTGTRTVLTCREFRSANIGKSSASPRHGDFLSCGNFTVFAVSLFKGLGTDDESLDMNDHLGQRILNTVTGSTPEGDEEILILIRLLGDFTTSSHVRKHYMILI